MSELINAVALEGTLKNVVARAENVVTGNISLRGEDGKCITTMPLVFINNGDSVLELKGAETYVKIVGRLATRFDRRPMSVVGSNENRNKPFTQIEVDTLTVL